jgi:hypothetical protein
VNNGLASSINLLLPEAVSTGFLDVVPNAIVREITTDKNTGKVNGAYFIDRHSRREMHVKARVIVVAAGTLESTRLLLNSGIANSSGVMGHYLIDQIYGCKVVAAVPEAMNGKAGTGLMGGSVFLPRFRNLKKGERIPSFAAMLCPSAAVPVPTQRSSPSTVLSYKRSSIRIAVPVYRVAFMEKSSHALRTTFASTKM